MSKLFKMKVVYCFLVLVTALSLASCSSRDDDQKGACVRAHLDGSLYCTNNMTEDACGSGMNGQYTWWEGKTCDEL